MWATKPSILRTLLGILVLVSDDPCLSWAAYIIGKSLGTLEVFPNLYDCGQWNGQNSRGMDSTVLMCGSRGPSLKGLWARNVGTEV